MDQPPKPHRSDRRFSDLRARREYRFRVAELLRAQQRRHVDQVIQIQRRQRSQLPR